jgi:hypothetical protein
MQYNFMDECISLSDLNKICCWWVLQRSKTSLKPELQKKKMPKFGRLIGGPP